MNPLDDHFRAPRNVGVLEGADVHAEVENPVCGDILHLYLKCDDQGRVARASFQVYGCPASIAAGSVLSELVIGKDRNDLREISQAQLDQALGGLPAEKVHVTVLARGVIVRALEIWEEES